VNDAEVANTTNVEEDGILNDGHCRLHDGGCGDGGGDGGGDDDDDGYEWPFPGICLKLCDVSHETSTSSNRNRLPR
jgi:hypothetical protein